MERARPLPAPAAAEALARIPFVAAEAASGFVEERAVYRAGEVVAVALPADAAVTGEALLYAPVCWPPPRTLAAYEELAAALAAIAPDCGGAVVRLQQDGFPPAGEPRYRPVSLYLDADAGAFPAAAPGDPVAVHAARTPAERQLVRELLAEAVAAGHRGVGDVPAAGEIDAAVEALLAGEDGEPRPESLVARVGGSLAGHVTFQPGWTDEVTLRRYHRVIDVFVLEAYRQAGVTGALTRAVAALARQREQPLLGEVTWDRTGDWERITGHLQGAGWRINHVLVHVDLSAAHAPAGAHG